MYRNYRYKNQHKLTRSKKKTYSINGRRKTGFSWLICKGNGGKKPIACTVVKYRAWIREKTKKKTIVRDSTRFIVT